MLRRLTYSHSKLRLIQISARPFSGVYLHVEFPTSILFESVDWKQINSKMKQFKGLKSKTWLSGIDNNFVGGFYEFDTRQNAQNYIDNYLIGVAKDFGVDGIYKMYDKERTKDPSVAMHSPFFPTENQS